jgi:hypothetical protein
MPIKPIDLQTLFTQLDRVAKDRSAEKEGAALQQSIQGAIMQKKADEKSKAVQKANDAEDNSEQKVSIREDSKSATPRGDQREPGAKDGPEDGSEDDGDGDGVFRDPRLGGTIDILG